MLLHQCILMGKSIYRCWNYFGFIFCIPLGKYFKESELENEQYDKYKCLNITEQKKKKRKSESMDIAVCSWKECIPFIFQFYKCVVVM